MTEIKDIINKGRSEFKTSKGNTISIKKLPMSVGIRVAKEIITLLAPSIGAMTDGIQHDEFLHGAPTSFTNLAHNLVSQLDKVNIEQMINTLLTDMYVNGDVEDLEEYFSANYDELVETMEFALRENFSTFFTGKGMKARLITAMTTIMPQGTSPTPSDKE